MTAAARLRALDRGWPRDLVYSLAAAGLAIVVLLPALVQPTHLIYPSWSEYSDLALIHWPKATLVRGSLSAGDGWPLWAPGQLSGQPLAANQLAMLFYPPALLLLAGPLPWAFSLFLALHLAWAGIGTYWLARALDRPPGAALLAAGIVALSGKLAAHTAIGHASLVPAFAWVPWALFFLHRALTRRSLRYALLCGVALAAQAATHTYALIYTAYGLVVYAAAFLLLAPVEGQGQATAGRLREALGHVPRLAVVPVVAAVLGAAQLLPLGEMALRSNRSLSLGEATLFSLSPLQTLTGVLFPAPNVGHEWTIYPGLLTIGLAAAAVLGLALGGRRQIVDTVRRQWPWVALAALVLGGAVLALGRYTPVYGPAYRLLPGVSWLRTPARLWYFVTLGLAVLAAYGLETWQALWRRPRWRRIARVTVAAAMAAGVLLSAVAVLAWHQASRAAWGLGVFGLLSGGLLLWASSRRAASRLGALALAIVAVDLLSFDWTLIRLVPVSEAMSAGREAMDWLAAQTGPFRTYSPSYSLPQPAVTQAGLEQIDGVEPVHLAAYDEFMAVAGGYGKGAFSVTIPPFPEGAPNKGDPRAMPDLALLGLLNGRYLASAFPLDAPGLALRWQDGSTWIYENTRALSRAFVVHQVETAGPGESLDQQIARLQAMNPGSTALAQGGERLAGPDGGGPAEVIARSPNRVTVQAELEAPGLLVVSEMWYPGWQARDNGRLAPIVRTDAILRGVYLDAGQHVVEFRYMPWTVTAGLALSAAATVLLLVYFAVPRRRKP